MKTEDFKNRTVKELEVMLQEQRSVLGKLRFELANKSLKDFSKINKTKKIIARILTSINHHD